eukprot:335473-Prorocentrum_minimum.AAC.1
MGLEMGLEGGLETGLEGGLPVVGGPPPQRAPRTSSPVWPRSPPQCPCRPPPPRPPPPGVALLPPAASARILPPGPAAARCRSPAGRSCARSCRPSRTGRSRPGPPAASAERGREREGPPRPPPR